MRSEILMTVDYSCVVCLINAEVKEDETGRACSPKGEERNAYRILAGKPDGKRPLGKPRPR
jgi:hypothetical protein